MPGTSAATPPPHLNWRVGGGVVNDVKRRLPWYKDDWAQGVTTKVIAPAVYIFFASALPALAFGLQLSIATEGTLNVVHVLATTALAGLVQSLVGGQPLLIIGVAEPIVIIYSFIFTFVKTTPGLGTPLFLPFCAWVCVFTSAMCCLLALLGACEGVSRFTRFSGELFGALIAVLFLQVGIKGIVHEFQPPAAGQQEPLWELTLINGLWGLLLALGLLLSCLKVLKARSWLWGRSWLRGFLAEYGVPLMVVVWSAVSFAVTPAPDVPRRVATPNTWQVTDTWLTAREMGKVPGHYVAAALLPAFVITVLFYFDHSVSSQLAQQPEFNLVKGPAYHYDFLLLSVLTLVCGLIGLPPVNGVLPQAPMHTRSLAHIRKQQLPRAAATAQTVDGTRSEEGTAAAEGCGVSAPKCDVSVEVSSHADARAATSSSQAQQLELRHRPAHPASRQGSELEPDQQQQQSTTVSPRQQQQQLHPTGSKAALLPLSDSSSAAAGGNAGNGGGPAELEEAGTHGYFLQLEVREQRVTNLLQSLLLVACLGLTPVIKFIPTGVLWGFFIYMAVASLDGSQFWERLVLLATDPKKRVAVLQQEHAAYLQTVPFQVVVRFTLFQTVYLLGVWALTTWAGIAGVAFPLPIMLLVPIRQYVLPLMFERSHLAQLDAASYEAAPAVSDRLAAAQELYALGAITEAPAAEPLDGDAGGSSLLQADEAELLSQEFRGVQLTHHVTRRSLEQNLHRRPQQQ